MERSKQKNKQKRFNPSVKMRDKLVQPASSGAAIDDIPMDNDTGKDFETLMNAPISEGGHFIFKSEKEWTVDVSQYSEYFTLDMKTLSAAINCIPFNKYVNVDDKYFTIDQLTHMQNAAEVGKQNYKTVINCLDALSNADTVQKDTDMCKDVTETKSFLDGMKDLNVDKDESSGNMNKDDSEDELDILLSLKEPAMENTASVSSTTAKHHIHDSTVPLNQNKAIKPDDLEKWLDSLIED